MICYKDRTFCHYRDCLNFMVCDRAYTEAVQQEAKNSGLLVSMYYEKPMCFALKYEIKND